MAPAHLPDHHHPAGQPGAPGLHPGAPLPPGPGRRGGRHLRAAGPGLPGLPPAGLLLAGDAAAGRLPVQPGAAGAALLPGPGGLHLLRHLPALHAPAAPSAPHQLLCRGGAERALPGAGGAGAGGQHGSLRQCQPGGQWHHRAAGRVPGGPFLHPDLLPLAECHDGLQPGSLPRPQPPAWTGKGVPCAAREPGWRSSHHDGTSHTRGHRLPLWPGLLPCSEGLRLWADGLGQRADQRPPPSAAVLLLPALRPPRLPPVSHLGQPGQPIGLFPRDVPGQQVSEAAGSPLLGWIPPGLLHHQHGISQPLPAPALFAPRHSPHRLLLGPLHRPLLLRQADDWQDSTRRGTQLPGLVWGYGPAGLHGGGSHYIPPGQHLRLLPLGRPLQLQLPQLMAPWRGPPPLGLLALALPQKLPRPLPSSPRQNRAGRDLGGLLVQPLLRQETLNHFRQVAVQSLLENPQ